MKVLLPVVCCCVFLLPDCALPAPAGDFELVPASLFHTRDGLGNVLARLEQGEDVRIGYLGGSITAQAGWRPKTLAWFQKQFPEAKVEEINGAIGGTGSDLGVFRYEQDILRHKPHMVFVEFAVNDGGASPEQIFRAMEGIVRQTWRTDPDIDLCFVYTIHRGQLGDYQSGKCTRSASVHEAVAEHYGIPSICMALRVAELEKEGKLVFPADPEDPANAGKIVFARDDCHPTDAGHDIFLEVIADAIEKMRPDSKPGPHELKTPIRADNWEQAKLVPLTPKMLSGSWKKLPADEGLGKRFGNRMPEIWYASTPGDKLEFAFRGTMVGLYDLLGPDGGKVQITLDGKTGTPRQRFDWYCTYHRLASLRMAQDLEDGPHTVCVELLAEQPDRSPVLDRVRDEPGFDPKRYDGTNLWVGSIMLIGELAESP